MDLIQEGNLGLMQAIAHFHQSGESEFRTYAYLWIRGTMIRAIMQQERSIRVPVRTLEAIRRMERCRERLVNEMGREVTDGEVANALPCSVERVRDLMVIQAQHMESLDILLGKEENETLADHIADPATVERDESLTTLREFVGRLPLRQQALIWLRYDIKNGQIRTQAEVAGMLNLSPALVSVLDRQIRLRLKKSLAAAEATTA